MNPGCDARSLVNINQEQKGQNTYMDHGNGDALVMEIIGKQLSNHVGGCFASVMPKVTASFFFGAQADGPPFGSDEDKL